MGSTVCGGGIVNEGSTRPVFIWSFLVVFVIFDVTLAMPVYIPNQATDNQIAVEIRHLGASPEDSDRPYRWYWSYEDRFPIEFESVLGSADISDGSDWQAVSSALDRWEAVPNSSITSSLNSWDGDWGGLNGDNELSWIETDWQSIGDFNFSPDAIGVAVTWYYTDTLIQVESDIFFNNENFSWYTDTDDSGLEQEFVEHIVLHELGHSFSLADLYDLADADRTMYGYSGYRDEDVTLHAGDIAALEYAYPVPEPGAILLIGLGGLALSGRRRA